MKRTIAACAITALAVGGGSATAATLITGKDVKNGSLTSADVKNSSLKNQDIKKNSISLNRLSPGSQALLRRAGTPGAPGKPGANGANGTQGPAGANGAAGATGEPGDDGATITGANGANPALPVLESGDQGFVLFGTAQDTANSGARPSLESGELTLPAGTDSRPAVGGLSAGKDIGQPLADLTAFAFTYNIKTRGNGNTKQAPSAVFTLSGATGTTPGSTVGFTNVVCEPIYTQADADNRVPATGYFDAVQGGQCFSTRAISGQPTQSDRRTIAQIKASNPNATLGRVSINNSNQADVLSGADSLLLGLEGENVRYDFGG